MNERIRELWEESTGATVPAEGFYSSASAYNIEKFAELIVQECAGVGNRAMYPDSDPDYVGRKIRKHFGVEE